MFRILTLRKLNHFKLRINQRQFINTKLCFQFKQDINGTLTSGGFLKSLSDIKIANSTGKISLISKLTRNIQRLLLKTSE